jgi:hypothetical protein
MSTGHVRVPVNGDGGGNRGPGVVHRGGGEGEGDDGETARGLERSRVGQG